MSKRVRADACAAVVPVRWQSAMPWTRRWTRSWRGTSASSCWARRWPSTTEPTRWEDSKLKGQFDQPSLVSSPWLDQIWDIKRCVLVLTGTLSNYRNLKGSKLKISSGFLKYSHHWKHCWWAGTAKCSHFIYYFYTIYSWNTTQKDREDHHKSEYLSAIQQYMSNWHSDSIKPGHKHVAAAVEMMLN